MFVFIAMIFCGALTGIVFDVFRAFRKCVKSGGGVIAVQDIALWLAELAVVFITVFKVNNAAVRLYEIIGLAAGSVLYFITVSQYALRALCAVLGLAKKAAGIVLSPVKKLAVSAASRVSRGAGFLREKASSCMRSSVTFARCKLSGIKSALKKA